MDMLVFILNLIRGWGNRKERLEEAGERSFGTRTSEASNC